jgi:DnaJ-class molecular chaperone
MRVPIQCPRCSGKGHVLDKTIAIGLPLYGWLFAPFEGNDPNGITRQTCPTCAGEGVVMRKVSNER